MLPPAAVHAGTICRADSSSGIRCAHARCRHGSTSVIHEAAAEQSSRHPVQRGCSRQVLTSLLISSQSAMTMPTTCRCCCNYNSTTTQGKLSGCKPPKLPKGLHVILRSLRCLTAWASPYLQDLLLHQEPGPRCAAQELQMWDVSSTTPMHGR